MNLDQLMAWAQDKTRFQGPGDYADFCEAYLDFIFHGLQAVIVSQNENHYRFFQYREDGNFNVTRPVNSRLFLSQEDFVQAKGEFSYILQHVRDIRGDLAPAAAAQPLYLHLSAVHRRRPGCPPRREEQHRP